VRPGARAFELDDPDAALEVLPDESGGYRAAVPQRHLDERGVRQDVADRRDIPGRIKDDAASGTHRTEGEH
jgi:hypothetical protein